MILKDFEYSAYLRTEFPIAIDYAATLTIRLSGRQTFSLIPLLLLAYLLITMDFNLHHLCATRASKVVSLQNPAGLAEKLPL